MYTVSDVGTEPDYSDAFKALYSWFAQWAFDERGRLNG